jgi:uncharacterized membrane protein
MRAFIVGICAALGLAGFAAGTGIQYKFSSTGYGYPGAAYTDPEAINLFEIVGYYVTPTISWGYIEDLRKAPQERFQSVQPAGSWTSWLSGINARGVAVGGYCSPPQPCTFPAAQNGFTLDHGVFTNIDYPGAETTTALGINDRGDIVGGYCNENICPDGVGVNQTDNAFLDKEGAFTTIDFPGATETQANAINNAGVIVGAYLIDDSGPHGFIYQSGTFTNIAVPGSTFTYPRAINNKGVVAGYYQTVNTTIHGFLRYEDGTYVTVDHPGTPASPLSGINDAGVIVGNWSPQNGYVGYPLPYRGVPVRTSP